MAYCFERFILIVVGQDCVKAGIVLKKERKVPHLDPYIGPSKLMEAIYI